MPPRFPGISTAGVADVRSRREARRGRERQQRRASDQGLLANLIGTGTSAAIQGTNLARLFRENALGREERERQVKLETFLSVAMIFKDLTEAGLIEPEDFLRAVEAQAKVAGFDPSAFRVALGGGKPAPDSGETELLRNLPEDAVRLRDFFSIPKNLGLIRKMLGVAEPDAASDIINRLGGAGDLRSGEAGAARRGLFPSQPLLEPRQEPGPQVPELLRRPSAGFGEVLEQVLGVPGFTERFLENVGGAQPTERPQAPPTEGPPVPEDILERLERLNQGLEGINRDIGPTPAPAPQPAPAPAPQPETPRGGGQAPAVEESTFLFEGESPLRERVRRRLLSNLGFA